MTQRNIFIFDAFLLQQPEIGVSVLTKCRNVERENLQGFVHRSDYISSHCSSYGSFVAP